ncbi:NAD-dependent malic enzyme, mitochondrial [Knufia obscura]|uniref:Malic enzyme n=2 Tax=Knufia TaxID=430999 RepID=A0AAN8I574_9EURO|nr:NAD-dependent malic enzyme, mitochondrial [Knufia obscura]KAK5955097.1 NAD-dependent malic enzyme, mitochondrial [Knufia fluminis]
MGKYDHLPLADKGPINVPYTGRTLISDSYYNKGTAFSHEERHHLGLHGMLPTNLQVLDQQVARAYEQYSSFETDLEKNTFMTSMAEQNVVLYYRLIQDHLKEMFSIIYTPTESAAIENFSRIFRRPDGCFLPIIHPNEVEERLSKFVVPNTDDGGIDYIVVSDGEQILGIGDQGIGGVLISVAKLAITTICAGIHPNRTLAVVLDVGTNNKKLLDDDLYLGYKHERVRGKQYDEFIEKFMKAAKKLFPNAYVHFEDFGVHNARRLLDQYRQKYAIFNDDVQGTGCVTLASIMAAIKLSKTKLGDIKVISFGAGSAGTGIAEQVASAIASDAGITKEEAKKQIFLIDKQGLLLDSDDSLSVAQKPFAHPSSDWSAPESELKDLKSLISKINPNVLIGTSTVPGAFTEDAIREMAKHVERPIIFPLSNPTKLHEAQPKDLFKWTDGKAFIATGSPFPPVEHNGQKYEVAECNNSVCFPGIGLGCVLGRVKLLTDEMLVAAVSALADEAPAVKQNDPTKELCPGVEAVRDVSVKIAMGVLRQAGKDDLLGVKDVPLEDDKELEEWIRAQMWQPEYRELVLDETKMRAKADP